MSQMGNNQPAVIDVSNNMITDHIDLGGLSIPPFNVVLSPDGKLVYFSASIKDSGDGAVFVVETSDIKAFGTINVGADSNPRGLAVTPDGSFLYVSSLSGNTVSVIQTSDNKVIDAVGVGGGAIDLAVTPDGNFIYVANKEDDSLSVFSNTDTPMPDTVDLGSDCGGPSGLAVTSDGEYLYVVCGFTGKVAVLEIENNTVFDIIDVGCDATCDLGNIAITSTLGLGDPDPMGGRNGSSSNSCALASPGAASSFPLYLLIPAFILINRLWRKRTN